MFVYLWYKPRFTTIVPKACSLRVFHNCGSASLQFAIMARPLSIIKTLGKWVNYFAGKYLPL